MNYFIYNYIISLLTRGRYEVNKLTSLPMCGFIAQLVEHRTGIAEVTGSNPVEALIFQASSFQLLKLENSLRGSFFTFIYNRSSYELFHIYLQQEPFQLQNCHRIITFCSVDQINCSLFALHIETHQWILKFTARSEHVLRTLRQHLDLNTTRKRFEPGRNLFRFPVAHSAPLKCNCSYQRSHTDQLFFSLTS